MKRFLLVILSSCLFGASPSWALTPDEARHLLHRTGYGVSVDEWNDIIDKDYVEAVEFLIEGAIQHQPHSPPAWVWEKPLYTISQKGWSEAKRKELRIDKRAKIKELREWWLHEMFTTSSPLQERMTMFWSNHFTTEFRKNNAPMLIYRQHRLLRDNAMQRFDVLLHKVLRDPAMLLYLDNDKNNRKRVNENLARELMELFTLGEGHYSEADVKQSARCLTGWGVDRRTGKFIIDDKKHDKTIKTVLGQSGNYDGDGLADLLLGQPQTARLIINKLWLEFVSLTPDPSVVNRWAKEFQADDYKIAPLLKKIFLSKEFRAPSNYGGLIKSPTELYAGIIRPAMTGLTKDQQQARLMGTRPGKRIVKLLEHSGQSLFNPPNVKGWRGGRDWVDSRTLLVREQVLRKLMVNLVDTKHYKNPYLNELLSPRGAGDAVASKVIWQLNAINAVTAIPATHTPRRALLALIIDPTIHLK